MKPVKINAYLQRKPECLCTPQCQVEKVVELSTQDFDAFVYSPLGDREFIAENKKLMRSKDGVDHCLLVLGSDRVDGVLVNSEGYDWARYAAYLPSARIILNAAVEQAAQLIIKEGTETSAHGMWRCVTGKLFQQTGLVAETDNGIGSLLLSALRRHPEVDVVELHGKVFELQFHLDHCKNLSPEIAPAESQAQRQARIADRLIAFLAEHDGSEELYQTLRGELGLSIDEIERMGFDLAHRYDYEPLPGINGPEL